VFSQVEAVRNLGLDVPVFADLAYTVSERLGLAADRSILYSREPALAGIREMLRRLPESYVPAVSPSGTMDNSRADARTVLKVSHLSLSMKRAALPHWTTCHFSVREGEIFAIIGHSGSGKTTLITHLNGLMRPESGDVFVYPKDRAEPLMSAGMRMCAAYGVWSAAVPIPGISAFRRDGPQGYCVRPQKDGP
jgi:energy-coupling factor transport system ATP-binding protein